MPKKYIFLIGLIIIPFFISAQINVGRLAAGTDYSSKDGFFYSLPRMGVRLNVEYEKIIKIKGPYSDYANELLGLEDIIASNYTEYRIKALSLETFYLPDPEQIYFVEYDSKEARNDNELKLNFSSKGFFVGSLNYPDMKALSPGIMEQENDISVEEIERYFKYFADDNLYNKIDTIVKKIAIDTITIDTYSYKSNTVEKYPILKAKEAVVNITQLRESQYNLITGYQEVAYSEGAFEFMYNKLKNMEKEYLDMFRGKILKEEFTYSSVFIPGSEDNDTWIPVIKFSSKDGPSQETEGDNVFVKFGITGNTTAIKESYDAASAGTNGLFYRIPEYSTLSIRYKQQSAEVLQTLIPQFGAVVTAPYSAENISIYPETGNIRSAVLKY